jgi:hypothetical protein
MTKRDLDKLYALAVRSRIEMIMRQNNQTVFLHAKYRLEGIIACILELTDLTPDQVLVVIEHRMTLTNA